MGQLVGIRSQLVCVQSQWIRYTQTHTQPRLSNVNLKFILLHKRRPWKNASLRILSAVFPALSLSDSVSVCGMVVAATWSTQKCVLFFSSFNWLRQFVVAEGGDEPFWQVQLPDVETCGSYVEPNKCSVCRRACGRVWSQLFLALASRYCKRVCWCHNGRAVCIDTRKHMAHGWLRRSKRHPAQCFVYSSVHCIRSSCFYRLFAFVCVVMRCRHTPDSCMYCGETESRECTQRTVCRRRRRLSDWNLCAIWELIAPTEHSTAVSQ